MELGIENHIKALEWYNFQWPWTFHTFQFYASN